MYAAVVAAARVVVGYLVVGPLVVGAAAAALLAANILVSYWFQRSRHQPGFGPRQRKPLVLAVDPPVARVAQLGFARDLSPAAAAAPGPATVKLRLERYPQLAAALAGVLQLVVRDFVQGWFGDLSTDASFPSVVLGQATAAVEAVAERCRRVDMAELAVGQLVPLLTVHARRAKTPADGSSADPMHPAIRDLGEGGNEKAAVLAHVRRVVDLLLPLVLPPEQLLFGPHRVLVRELLSGALLTPLLLAAADPDTANQLVDGQLERLIREQHMVEELRDALDQQSSAIGLGGEDDDMDDAEAGVRTYEQFMATIDQCQDLRELETITDDIVAQIRKRRILIMGQNRDDIVHGQRVSDVLVYINRLYVAKKKAERRAELLRQDAQLRGGDSGPGPAEAAGGLPVPRVGPAAAAVGSRPLRGRGMPANMSRASTYYEHRDDPARLGPPQFTLREILTNVSSLSAFTEYMDQAGRRTVLEFWVNVEGVRQTPAASMLLSSVVRSLWKSYFTLRVDELAEAGAAVADAVARVQRLLKPLREDGALDLQAGALSEEQSRDAFGLICAVQEAVFAHLEADVLPAFQRSALYSRLLREYYVTSRKDHMEAALFARTLTPLAEEDPVAEEEPATVPSFGTTAAAAAAAAARASAGASASVRSRSASVAEVRHPSAVRRSSVARSEAGSVAGSEAGSVARSEPSRRSGRWGFALWHREAPLVETDTATAVAMAVAVPQASMSNLMAEAPQESAAAACNMPLEPDEPLPAALAQRRRSVRVGRSELRRLSASLRTIAVAEEPELAVAAAGAPASDSEAALANGDSTLETGGLSSAGGSGSSAGSDPDSDDEAESLVLARVVKTPAPGDLFLDERLHQLAQEVERKVHQAAIVRALMRQAGTRHRAHELRVLRASYRGLRREVRAAAEQQRLYEAALEDHQLAPARTRIHIPRTVLSTGDDGDEHMVYLIELQQQSLPTAGVAPTGWMVARRYREFYALHRDLRALLPDEMRSHELPARTPLLRLQKRDVERRRAGLEAYLRALVAGPRLRNARPLRLFLSSTAPPGVDPVEPAVPGQSGWMSHIYKTVGEDIEGITGADSMLEIIVQELGAQVALQSDGGARAAEDGALFVDPLSDLFVEVFGLKSRRNWLRRQAMSVLLRHILGGAVERRVRLAAQGAVADSLLAGLVATLRQALWPEARGQPQKFRAPPPRSPETRAQTLASARARVLWYVPRLLGAMVGRRNARDGARLLFDAFQDRRANLTLALHAFDAAVVALFPEVRYQLDH
ncbi:tRNA (guanine-N(7)-)-methyltransferase (tRNA(m7G46)-methyltransferase) [Coemansia nantahalensis]|uniref:tRNA (Guanine-N(7)-)-methyltransferase (tRNA(m7G46)-methyltransferase) n=1 Tax=Coemansia nantahalensis TaxID=2789366 RepID=A0ACC1K921_9FUNG|nr:tRNA (guanine-N(7)-)-methyltransferase (tRNA(m7G46)-methyltransferase) [Coemansia nantahalensis]